MIAEKLLNLLISLSISGSILFGVWLIAHAFLQKKISRRSHYYLLLIVLLRFILPFSANQSFVGRIFSSLETFPFYEMLYGSVATRNPSVYIGENVIFKDNIIMGSKEQPFAPYILYFWLAIAFCLLIHKITKYQSFAKYIKSDWQPVDNPDILDILSEVCEEKQITSPIDLFTTPLVSSPLLLGITKNYIVLPHEKLSKEQLYNILSHEMTHYSSKDIYYKWFMQFIICIHWFNPVVYFIGKVMNRECEYACDEGTTRHFTKEEYYQYGATLIEMAKHPGRYNEKVGPVTLYENTNEIKKRLDSMLLAQKRKKPRQSITFLTIAVLIGLAFSLGAYTTRSMPVEDTSEEQTTDTSSTETDTTNSKPLGRHFS